MMLWHTDEADDIFLQITVLLPPSLVSTCQLSTSALLAAVVVASSCQRTLLLGLVARLLLPPSLGLNVSVEHRRAACSGSRASSCQRVLLLGLVARLSRLDVKGDIIESHYSLAS